MPCPTTPTPQQIPLNMPREFEDLNGLVEADLKAIASMLTRRAQERLLLSRKQSRRLHQDLICRLSDAINQTMAPHSAEWR